MCKDKLIQFVKSKKDIQKIYIASDSYKNTIFIIIVDDVTNNTTLDYIEYGFQIKETFKEVYDFMVLDIEEESSLEYMYENLEIIYKK